MATPAKEPMTAPTIAPVLLLLPLSLLEASSSVGVGTGAVASFVLLGATFSTAACAAQKGKRNEGIA